MAGGALAALRADTSMGMPDGRRPDCRWRRLAAAPDSHNNSHDDIADNAHFWYASFQYDAAMRQRPICSYFRFCDIGKYTYRAAMARYRSAAITSYSARGSFPATMYFHHSQFHRCRHGLRFRSLDSMTDSGSRHAAGGTPEAFARWNAGWMSFSGVDELRAWRARLADAMD